jgi:hypothetical protein
MLSGSQAARPDGVRGALTAPRHPVFRPKLRQPACSRTRCNHRMGGGDRLAGEGKLSVQHIYTFLVHPGRGVKPKPMVGVSVALSGKMFDLLDGVYQKSDRECDVDITFRPTPAGKQQNDCRDLIIKYVGKPTLAKGRLIAERLALNTDGRSGLGLLFLIVGKEGKEHKLVLSRFPTDSAIYVDENPGALTVEFLERVFMKNKFSYKAVVYKHASLSAGFWFGRAIDKQLNNPIGEQSNYWIADFLLSDYTITSATGTKRLAGALRDAAKKSPLEVKQELISAANLASGLAGQRVSIDSFASQFNLSQAAKDAIAAEIKSPRVGQEVFQFDVSEYRKLIAYKSIELDNGALLTAQVSEFDNVFHQEVAEEAEDEIKFSTTGKVVNEKLKTAP